MLIGASGADAEVVFELVSAADPLIQITGHVFSPGEVLVWLPSTGSFISAVVGRIVEKGNGSYAYQLTAGESATAGTVLVFALVGTLGSPVSQPFRDFAFIVDPLDPATHDLPFTLLPESDPVYDVAGLGLAHSWVLGELQVAFNTGVFFNAPTAQIHERGHNMYVYTLSPAERLNTNDVLVFADVATFVPFGAAWDMQVAAFISHAAPPPPGPAPTPPFVFPAPAIPGQLDHVQAAISRLCEQFRSRQEF